MARQHDVVEAGSSTMAGPVDGKSTGSRSRR